MHKRSAARFLRTCPASLGAIRPATQVVFQSLEARKLLFGDPVFDLGTLNGQNGFHIPAVFAGGELGFSTTAIGDLNGDGLDDFALSAPQVGPAFQEGRIYVVFGAANLGSGGTLDFNSLNGANGFVIDGADIAGRAGWSLAAVGDVNADGFDDLLIGVPFGNAACVVYGGVGVGASGFLFLGDLNGQNGFRIEGAKGDAIGFTVAAAGDVNDDGVRDILLGSPVSGNDTGIAYVVFGAAGIGSGGFVSVGDLNGTNGLLIPGLLQDDQFGWRVSDAGDLNADGVADFAVGALEAGTNGTGAVYVIFGKQNIGQGTQGFIDIAALDGSNGFVMRGPGPSAFFSTSISGSADVNGDGVHDLIVGSLIQNTYVIFGAAGIGQGGLFDVNSLDGTNGYIAFLPNGAAAFASHAGDLNGDGIGDVAIGAGGADEVWVFMGGPNVGAGGLFDVSLVDGVNGFVVQGVQLTSGFIGEPVARGKDLNGDGHFDLLIGAARAGNGDGEAFVLFGISIGGLSAPANLAATAQDASSINLSWTDTTLFEDGFEIERSLDGVTNWVLIASPPRGNGSGGVLTWLDENLNPDTEYFYRIRAFNSVSQSAFSNIASATTQSGQVLAPDAPTTLTAAAASESAIELNWSDNSDNEDGFIIERSTDPSGSWLEIDTVSANATQYVDSGLGPGQTFFYRVRAFNAAGSSDPSNVAGATTSPSEGGMRRVEFLDADGDLVIFSLVGVGGTITINAPDGVIDALYVAVNQPGVGSLVVSIRRAAEGDGRVQIGTLQGDIGGGDLFVRAGTISLAPVDIVGSGAWLCNVNRATFGDLLGSASIQGQTANLFLRDVNTTGGISLCDVYRFRARSLNLGGGFDAHSVSLFNVEADADFALNLGSPRGLGSMFIGASAVLELHAQRAGMINIRGEARFTGSSEVTGQLACLRVGGSRLEGSLVVGRLGKAVLIGSLEGSLDVMSADCVVIGGDFTGSFAASGAEGEVVRKFRVSGAAAGSRFAAVGDVGCLLFGTMDQAEVYVGLPLDWPGGLPSSLDDFLRLSILRKLQVAGPTRGATIGAATIVDLCLREIDSQQVFHLAAGRVERAKMIVENQPYVLGPNSIFTGLPMLPYLDLLQLFESGGT